MIAAAFSRGEEARALRADTAINAASKKGDAGLGGAGRGRARCGEGALRRKGRRREVGDDADRRAPPGSEREREGEREAGWACWAGLVACAAGKRKRGGEKGVGWSERRRERECLFILFLLLNSNTI